MVVMAMMPRAGEWSVEDLDAVPDDGLRYELVDGVLLVGPAPTPHHQRVVVRLVVLLHAGVTAEAEVLVGPVDFRPTTKRSLQPDVLVVNRQDVGTGRLTQPPLLVIEVLSPGSRTVDHLLKRRIYQDGGVPSYWIVDPDEPSVTVLELDAAGTYRQVAHAAGDQPLTVSAPFAVTVAPATLIET
jgi:Uma2 family endonuclease